jgi:hypothetical protein
MDGARGNSCGGGPAVFPNALPFEFDESWPVPNQVAADYRQVRECARVNMSGALHTSAADGTQFSSRSEPPSTPVRCLEPSSVPLHWLVVGWVGRGAREQRGGTLVWFIY